MFDKNRTFRLLFLNGPGFSLPRSTERERELRVRRLPADEKASGVLADITPRRHFHTNAPITPSSLRLRRPSRSPLAARVSSSLFSHQVSPLFSSRGAPESMNPNMIMRTSAGESSSGSSTTNRLLEIGCWKGGYTR